MWTSLFEGMASGLFVVAKLILASMCAWFGFCGFKDRPGWYGAARNVLGSMVAAFLLATYTPSGGGIEDEGPPSREEKIEAAIRGVKDAEDPYHQFGKYVIVIGTLVLFGHGIAQKSNLEGR